MIATSGAVAAHQILKMLLVARVAELDAVGGYSLPLWAGLSHMSKKIIPEFFVPRR